MLRRYKRQPIVHHHVNNEYNTTMFGRQAHDVPIVRHLLSYSIPTHFSARQCI